MGHAVEEHVDASEVVGRPGESASFGWDTCPERDVLVRIWHADQSGDSELRTYELTPEAALRLADRIREVAERVIARGVMRS